MKRIIKTQPVNYITNINPFILGLSRIFDFTQVINRPGNKTPQEIDFEALRNDWMILGEDMRIVLNNYEE
ncbi:MAG: hypothetical protein WCY84_03625 [Candidatus Cloacimonadaceae bacterium]